MPRERVGGHRAEQDLPDGDQRAHDHGVAQRGEEVDLGRWWPCPAASISSADASPRTCLRFSSVAPGGSSPCVARHQLGVGGERRAEHPEEREQADAAAAARAPPRRRSGPRRCPSWPCAGVSGSWPASSAVAVRSVRRSWTCRAPPAHARSDSPARSRRIWIAATDASRTISADGQRRGVAERVELERLLEDVQVHDAAGVAGPPGVPPKPPVAICDGVEHLEGADERDHEHQRQHRPQQRQGDGAEHLPLARAVERRPPRSSSWGSSPGRRTAAARCSPCCPRC